jgi:hypothetical protein
VVGWGRNTQLAKLLEPHAETLVAKMIELALSGDTIALRLCIERLIPKIRHEPLHINLPTEISEKSMLNLREEILLAAIQGRIGIDDAEKFVRLINDTHSKQNFSATSLSLPKNISAIEASKIYQQIMIGS